MFQLLSKSSFPLTILPTMLLRTVVFIFVAVNEHANWISCFAAVKKLGILTICIDPKDLNKALKRNHYYAKTLDDILPNLAKAKVFFSFRCKRRLSSNRIRQREQLLNNILAT